MQILCARLAACAVLALAGCRESMKSITDKQRPAAAPHLAKLLAIAADAEKRPRVDSDGYKLPAGEKLDFLPYTNSAFNASIVALVNLADPCAQKDLHWDGRPGGKTFTAPLDESLHWLAPVHCMLRDGTWVHGGEAGSPEEITSAYARFLATRYLLVLRVRTAILPEADFKEGAAASFEPGVLAGDALLYEIATGRYLGGFAWDVHSKDTVDVSKGRAGDDLLYDLLTDAAWTLRNKLEELPPGAVPPR